MTNNNQSALALKTNTGNTVDIFDVNRWQPISKFLNTNQQFNLGQIRYLLRFKKNNDFDSCIKKVGRRYYIHDQLFAKWIMNR